MSEYHKICHMITPGIDSLITYFYIIEKCLTPDMELELIHVSLSPAYSHIESSRMKFIEDRYLKHIIRYIDDKSAKMIVQEDHDGFIPSRNLYLATLVDITNIPNRSYKNLISFGFNIDDRVYDSSDEFCKMSTSVLSKNVSMGSLVRHISKLDLVKWFLNESTTLSSDKKHELLMATYSCYSGEVDECLACNACFRKSTILSNVGVRTRRINSLNEDFIRSRFSIINDETVSVERRKSVMNYAKSLLKIQKELDYLIEPYIKESNLENQD